MRFFKLSLRDGSLEHHQYVFLAEAPMTSSAKRFSKAPSSFPPKQLEAARYLATPFLVGLDVFSL
jgi:hypothetical protein